MAVICEYGLSKADGTVAYFSFFLEYLFTIRGFPDIFQIIRVDSTGFLNDYIFP